MFKILLILFIISMVALSGCIENDKAKVVINGDDDCLTGMFAKFSLIDQSGVSGNVSYRVCWDDGTCDRIKEMPISAMVPLKHAWFIAGDYTITARAMYDNGDIKTVIKMITIRE
jgi:hypothetical protein